MDKSPEATAAGEIVEAVREAAAKAGIRATDDNVWQASQAVMQLLIAKCNAEHFLPLLRLALDGLNRDSAWKTAEFAINMEIARLEAAKEDRT